MKIERLLSHRRLAAGRLAQAVLTNVVGKGSLNPCALKAIPNQGTEHAHADQGAKTKPPEQHGTQRNRHHINKCAPIRLFSPPRISQLWPNSIAKGDDAAPSGMGRSRFVIATAENGVGGVRSGRPPLR
jgi:hypothetical protein